MSYSVRIFDDIHNAKLKEAWIRLQDENIVFPQMQYEWVKSWVVSRIGNRSLHIVVVTNENDIVAIAPFCIERGFGINKLTTLPIHFGDFYTFIYKESEELITVITQYLKTCSKWNVVHLFNVNNNNLLFQKLREEKGFANRQIVKIHEANFIGLNFEEFLLTVSKNTRGQFRKKWNRLNREGDVKFEAIVDSQSYEIESKEMNALYNLRWADDDVPLLSQEYYSMRNKAIKPVFDNNNAILYKLTLNNKAIAYRLGFLSNHSFFDWKVVHDPKYNYYSPGNLLVGKIIEDIIPKGYGKFNFMTGDYRYKKSWISEKDTTDNFEIFYSKKRTLGQFYVFYRLKYRERIKSIYYKIKRG